MSRKSGLQKPGSIVEYAVSFFQRNERKIILTLTGTFSTYLTEEIFGRQPSQAFLRNRRSEKLLDNGLEVYLQYHSIISNSSQAGILSFILKCIDELLSADGNQSKENRAGYTKKVATIMKSSYFRYSTSISKLIANPDGKRNQKRIQKLCQDDIKTVCLYMAAIMPNNSLLRALAANGGSVWKETHAFGIPINVASWSMGSGLLDSLLQCAAQDNSDIPMNFKMRAMFHCITKAIGNKNNGEERASKLLKWQTDHLKPPMGRRRVALFQQAAESKSDKTLRAIISLGTTPASRQTYLKESLYRWPSMREQAIFTIPILLDEKLLNVDTLYEYKKYNYNIEREGGLLDFAVWLGDYRLVRRILSAGAHPDGLKDSEGNHTYPIRAAVALHFNSIVRVLLRYGANPQWSGYEEAILHAHGYA